VERAFNRLKVLYIAGWGRSGSTLLDNILGQLDRFTSIGELRYVWDRGLKENRLCGCGVAFRECTFWQRVFHEAFGGFDEVEPAEMLSARDKYDHARLVLLRRNVESDQIELYKSALVKLYRAISAVTRSNVVVDSSKTPSHGRILQGCPELDVRVVHLVRDSRAVAYSWQQKKLTRDLGGAYMTEFSFTQSSLLWDGMNAAAEILKTTDPNRYLRVRYEDFVLAAGATLQVILDLLGESGSQLPVLKDGKVALLPVHGFSGNPSRFNRGVVELHQDDEWRSKLKRRHWLWITALTCPLLARYGYPLFSLSRRQRQFPDPRNEAIDRLRAD